jgi:gliding motility-associated lipoprotein GldJ
MKMVHIVRTIATSIIVSLLLTSCGLFGGGGNNESSTTGWGINEEESGGFTANTEFTEQTTGPGLVFIEGGSFTMGKVQDDVMRDWNNLPSKQHVRSFYMDETEVTNISYREYLYWLKRVFPISNDKFKYIYYTALPDTLVWRDRLGANETFVDHYLRHPAYNNYPVVGVSWIQASRYAEWRTDRVNEKILIEEGILRQVNDDSKVVSGANHFNTRTYLEDPNKVFSQNEEVVYNKLLPDYGPNNDSLPSESALEGRHANIEDGILLPRYRLPTEAEWEYAALALVGNREFNNIKGKKKFPWNGKNGKSDNKRSKGDHLANYKIGTGDYKGIAGWSSDGADITNKVKSYPPNDFGLYDMAGNVAEWVADIYRPTIDHDHNDFSYYRGNVFYKKKVDANGEIVYVGEDDPDNQIVLSDGSIAYKQLPGSPKKEKVTSDDTFLRSNYSQANHIDYQDGDNLTQADEKRKMYDSPELGKIERDPRTGKIVTPEDKRYDNTNSRTSLINDKVRVYKGGSWKDRLYWLDPAQRRFLQEDLSTNFIGFRCAMDRLGHEEMTREPIHNK